jgi:hypothetical protein
MKPYEEDSDATDMAPLPDSIFEESEHYCVDCGIQGVCIECYGCFHQCCTCDPCQHGRTRQEKCVFCEREKQ